MKTKRHMIGGASLTRIEELASSIDYRVPDWVPYTVAIDGTAAGKHFSGLLRECAGSDFVTDGQNIVDEEGGLHDLGGLLEDAAERLDQAHQDWLETETSRRNVLYVEVRNIYGVDRFYPANDKARTMAEMLGRKTLNQEDLITLHEKFGFEIRLTNALAHDWLKFATSSLLPRGRQTAEDYEADNAKPGDYDHDIH